MHVYKFARSAPRWAGPLCVAVLLGGCTSTPQHTNVLIFGTHTKFALDVSQDAVNGAGLTLGYKRQEAVWMPLLPNQAGSGNGPVPAACSASNACPKFEGRDTKEGTDTYSVLASFGATAGGGTNAQDKNVGGKASIAQYFATGLAARLLADKGGADLVRTDNLDKPSAATQEQAQVRLNQIRKEFTELIDKLSDPGEPGGIHLANRTKAFSKPPGQTIPVEIQDRIKKSTSVDDLRRYLPTVSHDKVSVPMLTTINAD